MAASAPVASTIKAVRLFRSPACSVERHATVSGDGDISLVLSQGAHASAPAVSAPAVSRCPVRAASLLARHCAVGAAAAQPTWTAL